MAETNISPDVKDYSRTFRVLQIKAVLGSLAERLPAEAVNLALEPQESHMADAITPAEEQWDFTEEYGWKQWERDAQKAVRKQKNKTERADRKKGIYMSREELMDLAS